VLPLCLLVSGQHRCVEQKQVISLPKLTPTVLGGVREAHVVAVSLSSELSFEFGRSYWRR
jgi:hypothetical protein